MKENAKRIIAGITFVAIVVAASVGLIVAFNTIPDGTPSKDEPLTFEDMISKYGSDFDYDMDEDAYYYRKEWCGVPGNIAFYFTDERTNIYWEMDNLFSGFKANANTPTILFNRYCKLLERKGLKLIEDKGYDRIYVQKGDGWIQAYEVNATGYTFWCLYSLYY